jgi:hypothetical protein
MRPRSVFRGRLAILAFLMSVSAVSASPRPASAISAITQEHGFDACAAPTSATMDAWWPNTIYSTIGIYLGGGNRACPQPNLTAAWITHQQARGWAFIPTWVGPQMSWPTCRTVEKLWNSNISTNTSTAYDQGRAEAVAAFNAAGALGMSTNDMPLAYDLEGYTPPAANATLCRNAAKSFMKGWADFLAVAPAQKSGLYGSACNTYMDDFAYNGNPPDFVWIGDWSGNTHTSVVTGNCVAAAHWNQNQRHKQYVGGHNETHNGVTIRIDNDCSNGPVYFGSNRFVAGSNCI